MSDDLTIRYPALGTVSRVRVAPGGLDRLGEFTRLTSGARRGLVVSDTNVAALYGARAMTSLRRSGIDATLLAVPAGERSKSTRRLSAVWTAMSAGDLDRSAAVIALGGGVVGDLAGFAAATWLRGISWVSVPTTLLAQVDSGVGGKTGIDLPRGKNLIGAFHQPAGILVDPETLATLPSRQLRSGLAEVVKMGMAVDAALFAWTEHNAGRVMTGEPKTLADLVGRSIRVKARVVRRDERESEGGGRGALNYGHTLGHALEAALGYRGLLHGEAVAIGMRVAASLSLSEAGLAASARARQDALLDRFGLPRTMPPTPIVDLLEAMRGDKKRRAGRIRWVLTTRVGRASVPRLISNRLVQAALLEAGARVE